MSLKWFEDLKMNNTSSEISPLFAETMDLFLEVGNSTYVGNGLSNTGLDLSYGAGAYAAGGLYASKIIQTNNDSYFCTGFLLSDYQYLRSTLRLPNPTGNLPAGFGRGVSLSDDANYLAVAHNSSPFVSIYKRTVDTFTKLLNPASLPTVAQRAASFSPRAEYLALTGEGAPLLIIYKRSGDTFTRLPDVAELPAGTTSFASKFSPDGNYLVVGTNGLSDGGIFVYQRTGDTFTKIWQTPSTTPIGISISGDGGYIAAVHSVSPFFQVFKREGLSYTPLPTPTAPITTNSTGCAISPDGTQVAVLGATAGEPLITYTLTPDELIKNPAPSQQIAGTGNCAVYSADSNYLIAGGTTSPYIFTYTRDGNNNYTRLPNLSGTSPPGGINAVTISDDGSYVSFASSITPFVGTYKMSHNTIFSISNSTSLATISDNKNLFVPKLFIRLSDSNIGLVLYTATSTIYGSSYDLSSINLLDKYFELEIEPTSARLYINGVLVSTLNSPDLASLISQDKTLTYHRDAPTSGTGTLSTKFTDVYALDGENLSESSLSNRLGPITIQSQRPVSDIQVSGWNPIEGPELFDLVNEDPVNMATFIFSNESDAFVRFNMGEVTYDPADVIATSVNVYAKSTDITASQISINDGVQNAAPVSTTTKVRQVLTNLQSEDGFETISIKVSYLAPN